MAHFAAFAGNVFFIQVQADAGNSQSQIEAGSNVWILRVQPDFSEEIHNRGGLHDRNISQRKIAHSADGLFKLAGDAGAFAGVIAIVRSWSEFIHQ